MWNCIMGKGNRLRAIRTACGITPDNRKNRKTYQELKKKSKNIKGEEFKELLSKTLKELARNE